MEHKVACSDCGAECIDAGAGLGWQCVNPECTTPALLPASNFQKAVEEIRMICSSWGLDYENPEHQQIVIDKVMRVAFGLSDSEGPPDSADGGKDG